MCPATEQKLIIQAMEAGKKLSGEGTHKIKKLEANNARLVDALEEYGQHLPHCNTILDDESDQVLDDYQECTCGLDKIKALTHKEEK